jgi:O-antigen ligase
VALLTVRKPYSLFFTDFGLDGRASGTFANPDHLAGYMQLCLAAGIGLMVAQFSRHSGGQEGFRSQSVALLRFLMSPKVLVRLALVLLVVALVMTHSRMGNGAFFITLLLVGALVAALSQRLRRPALWLVGSMVVIDVLVIGNLVGLERVVERVQQTTVQAPAGLAASSGRHLLPREQSLAERLEVPRLSLALVEQRPMFGWGAGSYALAFAPIKPDTVYAGYWDHAHNDYVQVAVDTGLVGLALWAGIGALTLGQALPLLRDGRSRLQQGVGAAAITALMCLGLHGMVDFNLHIPANALTLAVLSSLVWVAPSLGSPHKARSRSYDHSAEDSASQ